MSITTEIQRLQDAKEMIRSVIIEKGVNVPDTEKIDNYPYYISQIGRWHSSNPLCFTAEEDDTIISLYLDKFLQPEYSFDGIKWNQEHEGDITVSLNKNEKVFIRSLYLDELEEDEGAFNITKNVKVSGNPESLHERTAGKLYPLCYYCLFYGLPITTPPELPATELAEYCYNSMFYDCSNLTTAPELPATNLAPSCYSHMFAGCSNLTTAPELPATTLTSWCYAQMFEYCYSLTTAPELPATTLADNCYSFMFNRCLNLNYIKVGATSWNTSYTNLWVDHVSSTGTFVKPISTSIPRNTSGIPSGWTVENY